MDVNNQDLKMVFDKLRLAWYPQEDENGTPIELCEVNQRNVSLETPIMIAAQLLDPSDIEVLVRYGANINAKSGSEQHHSALHIARLMGRFDNAQKLIELGADVNLLDRTGKTPMQYGSLTK